MKKYDFRLNKQELTSLLMLFLAKAGKSETLSTQNNVEYRISPSEKLIFIYGKHNNAQEVNNNFDYDIIDAVVEKYVNGYFVKSYVFGLKIKDFQLDMHGKLFNNNNYATSYFLRNIDFYKYVFNFW